MKLTKSVEQDFFIHIDEVLPALSGIKKQGKEWTALCPSHDDHRNSLSVGRGADDRALLHCHAGCEYFTILQSLGLYKEATQTATKKEISTVYDYFDEDGELRYQVVRFIPKSFGQRRPDGEGGWIWNLKGVKRILYKLPELIHSESNTVFISEGEKDIDNLYKLGFTATTNSSGAKKWDKSFNKYFKGKDVVILPHNDEAGRSHAELVAKNLYSVAASVRIINLEGLEEHGDVSDWIEKDETSSVETLKALVIESNPLQFEEDELELDEDAPSYYEGEASIVGAIFKDPSQILKIEEDLPNQFYDSKLKSILKAIVACHKEKQGVDLITVAEKLRQGNKLDLVGGHAFLKSLKDDVVDTLNIDSWINIVISKAQFRSYIKLANKLEKNAQRETDNPENLKEEAIQELLKLSKNKKDSFVRISEPLFKIVDDVKNNKGVVGVSTGFKDIDDVTGGLLKTDLIVVAGRSSQGKTSYALNVAYNASKENNVLFFSMEMSREQLIKRILCSEALVDSSNLRSGNLDKKDWLRIANVIPEMESRRLYINEETALSVDKIRTESYRFLEKTNNEEIGLIVVDYLTLMKQNQKENRFQEVSEIARELKTLSKELNVPIMALSQLSRAPEGRTPPRPIMSDLRASGEIEEAADVIKLLYRPEYYNSANENTKGLAEVIIAKQRNGPTGIIELGWVAKYTKFMNLLAFEPSLKS